MGYLLKPEMWDMNALILWISLILVTSESGENSFALAIFITPILLVQIVNLVNFSFS